MTPSSFNNIKTATTTTVKSGPGIFRKMIINTTAAGAVTIYDNTAASGTTIGTFPISATVGTYIYDLRFSVGLTIVTGAASDITVTYE